MTGFQRYWATNLNFLEIFFFVHNTYENREKVQIQTNLTEGTCHKIFVFEKLVRKKDFLTNFDSFSYSYTFPHYHYLQTVL